MSRVEDVIRQAEEVGEEILLLEPRSSYDACLIGVVRRFNSYFALYSTQCVLEVGAADIRADQTGPDEEQTEDEDPAFLAREHFEFNIVGGWVGDATPAFLMDEEE